MLLLNFTRFVYSGNIISSSIKSSGDPILRVNELVFLAWKYKKSLLKISFNALHDCKGCKGF